MTDALISEWVRRWTHLIAPNSQVLDVACGTGRHMQWLAGNGHLPLGLDSSQEALNAAAVFGSVLLCDLETQPWPLQGRQFGGVLVTNYLHRPLLSALVRSLAPGGVLIYETFAQGNADFGRPRNPDYLLLPGELLHMCTDLYVVAYENGLLTTPLRAVQRIVAIKAGTESSAPPSLFP